jgi:hypothetical protein
VTYGRSEHILPLAKGHRGETLIYKSVTLSELGCMGADPCLVIPDFVSRTPSKLFLPACGGHQQAIHSLVISDREGNNLMDHCSRNRPIFWGAFPLFTTVGTSSQCLHIRPTTRPQVPGPGRPDERPDGPTSRGPPFWPRLTLTLRTNAKVAKRFCLCSGSSHSRYRKSFITARPEPNDIQCLFDLLRIGRAHVFLP